MLNHIIMVLQRRTAVVLSIAGIVACSRGTTSVPTPTARQAGNEADVVARARAIHSRVITVDTHKDIPDNFATAAADPKTMNAQVNLDKMKAGGYSMAFFAVYVGQGERTDSGNAAAKARAMNKFNAIHRMAEQMYPNLIEIAYTPEDVIRIHNAGKLIAGIGIENVLDGQVNRAWTRRLLLVLLQRLDMGLCGFHGGLRFFLHLA